MTMWCLGQNIMTFNFVYLLSAQEFSLTDSQQGAIKTGHEHSVIMSASPLIDCQF